MTRQTPDRLGPLLLLLVLVCSPCVRAEAPSYREIVLSLANAPLEQRRLFASMALEELIRRHEQEAQRAARGKSGWQRGMRSYISKLQAVLGRVPISESVVLVVFMGRPLLKDETPVRPPIVPPGAVER